MFAVVQFVVIHLINIKCMLVTFGEVMINIIVDGGYPGLFPSIDTKAWVLMSKKHTEGQAT